MQIGDIQHLPDLENKAVKPNSFLDATNRIKRIVDDKVRKSETLSKLIPEDPVEYNKLILDIFLQMQESEFLGQDPLITIVDLFSNTEKSDPKYYFIKGQKDSNGKWISKEEPYFLFIQRFLKKRNAELNTKIKATGDLFPIL